MTHITCRLTAKNRDQLRNPTLGNRVRASRHRQSGDGRRQLMIRLQCRQRRHRPPERCRRWWCATQIVWWNPWQRNYSEILQLNCSRAVCADTAQWIIKQFRLKSEDSVVTHSLKNGNVILRPLSPVSSIICVHNVYVHWYLWWWLVRHTFHLLPKSRPKFTFSGVTSHRQPRQCRGPRGPKR